MRVLQRIANLTIGAKCKRQNRGPYQEDKCREHNIIENSIVDVRQYLGKSEKRNFCTIVSLFRILCY